MKRFMSKKVAVVGVAVAVLIGVGGAAFAYFSSPGGGTGSAAVGKASPLLIHQLGTPVYNSTLTDASAYQYSFAYVPSTDANEFGNDITLAGAGGQLTDVVVAMSNWTPTSGSGPLDITLNIYDSPGGSPANGDTPGSLIASDTQAFTIPSTAVGANPITGAGAVNFNITFDLTSQDVMLPSGSDIVYGIEYNNTSVDTGLNVQLSSDTSPNQVSVGQDTNHGWLYVSQLGAGYASGSGTVVGGSNGQVTCDTVSNTFAQYSTTLGNNGDCGLSPFVPAVEFYMNTMGDLYPNGVSQPINFSITNPGSGPATVSTVTVALATDGSNGEVESSPGNTTSDIGGCYASWFAINPGTGTSYVLTLDQTIPAGGTIDVTGQVAISMPTDPTDNQTNCEGASLGLIFTSN